ncbi:MAG: glycoside hydrolase domain-containing protein [Pseudobacter sp.]|uniref:DUF4091 domain-containing protein n=1 Tax=Pseudobacter sp. TaxID=2045420 RepID=UPI003F7D74B1
MRIEKIILLICLMGGPLILSAQQSAISLAFGNTDTRYPQKGSVTGLTDHWKTVSWKGEKVNAQLVIQSASTLKDISVKAGNLRSTSGAVIPATAVKVGFVGYVWSDGLNEEGHGCGIKPGADSSLQADGIHFSPSVNIAANSNQPVWVSIRIPQHAKGGTYNGILQLFRADSLLNTLSYSVMVLNSTLPEPAQWKFHLDLWQNPYSIARIHRLHPWSDQHFKAMKPYMKMLADAGQKAITVSMIHDPWRGQTYDIYQSMIRWIKKADGSWAYDYTIFDKLVEFMTDQGISKLINCYTMVPWNNKFYYFDEATGKDTVLIAPTGSPAFLEHWTPMLKNFAAHLKEKGWFSRTSIAMDERPLEDMKQVIALVRSIDKEFKISLAGSFHKELAAEIYDYCIASAETFDSVSLKQRFATSKPTTFYTYCFEGFPNTFTFSPPAESAFMGWYAANRRFSGYLRWAYNCWPANPLQDARFSTWSSGDTYFVYPGAGSSIRLEKLIEGIQDYEKIRIMREQLKVRKQYEKLQELEAVIKLFDIQSIPASSAADMLQKARRRLNSL